MKSETRLSIAASRKRSRDAMAMINPIAFTNFQTPIPIANNSLSFLSEDLSFQIQQQQLKINRFISQHNEKVRMEVEEGQKRHCKRITAEMEESILNRLKAKEAEIEKIGKLNWALEERVKSLCVENHIWSQFQVVDQGINFNHYSEEEEEERDTCSSSYKSSIFGSLEAPLMKL